MMRGGGSRALLAVLVGVLVPTLALSFGFPSIGTGCGGSTSCCTNSRLNPQISSLPRHYRENSCALLHHRRSSYRSPMSTAGAPAATTALNASAGGRNRIDDGSGSSTPLPPRESLKFTIMGGGSFGLALSHVLARNRVPTTLLVRDQTTADVINETHEHPRYLKGIPLPWSVHATADPAEALSNATHIIHAVPVQYSRAFLTKVRPFVPDGVPILSVSKGLETSTLHLVTDILKEICGDNRPYAFLSGPSFAREIAQNMATGVVIASEDTQAANELARILSSDTFRCFTSKDVVAVEVGGAVKNVIALAAGMCEGLGLGTNSMAALVTRGCAEMRRIAVLLGGQSCTLSGLSGVGDTFGTCFGPLSRNRNFGIRLGQGESMKDILASSTEVAEGVETARALAALIRRTDKGFRTDLKYPIIFGVSDIMDGKISPKEGLTDLMSLPLRTEMYECSLAPPLVDASDVKGTSVKAAKKKSRGESKVAGPAVRSIAASVAVRLPSSSSGGGSGSPSPA